MVVPQIHPQQWRYFQFSLAKEPPSLAAGAASADGKSSIFAGARTAKTSLISQQLAEQNLDYAFDDLYANVHAAPLGFATQLTFFTSSDHLATDSDEHQWCRRTDAVVQCCVSACAASAPYSRDAGVVASLAYASHEEEGTNLGFRDLSVDVNSRFATLTGQVDGHRRVGRGVALRYGGEIIGHDVRNDVVAPYGDEPRYPTTNQVDKSTELGGYAELALEHGSIKTVGGVRVDHAGGVTAVQPASRRASRGHIAHAVEVAVGRSAARSST